MLAAYNGLQILLCVCNRKLLVANRQKLPLRYISWRLTASVWDEIQLLDSAEEGPLQEPSPPKKPLWAASGGGAEQNGGGIWQWLKGTPKNSITLLVKGKMNKTCGPKGGFFWPTAIWRLFLACQVKSLLCTMELLAMWTTREDHWAGWNLTTKCLRSFRFVKQDSDC